jgi:hypothetical protein
VRPPCSRAAPLQQPGTPPHCTFPRRALFLTLQPSMIAPLLFLLGTTQLPAQQIDTLELRAHTRFLADDALKGRGTGTAGERMAALYIESQLLRLGVKALPTGFQQPVPMRRAHIDSARLTVRTGRNSSVFAAHEFVFNTGGEAALRGFRGPAVFLGTAEHARAASDADLKGRVVVLLGTLGIDAQTLIPRWLRAGVQGMVLLVPDSMQFDLFARSRGDDRFYIAATVDEPIWQSALPAIIGGPRLSRALVAQISEVVGRLARRDFAPVALDRDIEVVLHADTEPLTTSNVVGIIPGRDPALRGQYVLFSAHYDHLGVSTPDARGDSIYNGFSDNAAGVAMLLAIAQQLVRSPPARSIAFVFFTGEERGLLGSTYYAANPAIALDSTVAVINLDAGAPPAPPVEWRLAGGAASTIGATARTVATARGWKIEVGAASPNSDYWGFHVRGVPAVFLIPGNQWEGLTAAQRDALRLRWDRYHRADDEWSPDFPFRGVARYAQLALSIGRALADSRERPRMLVK